MDKLPPQCIDELEEVGFTPSLSAQVAEAEATALLVVGFPSSLPSGFGPRPIAGRGFLPFICNDDASTENDDNELREIENWCRDDSVSLPFIELPASNGAFLPLTKPEQEQLAEHLRTGHLKKTNLCRGCLEAEGPGKIDKATHTHAHFTYVPTSWSELLGCQVCLF